MARDLIKIKGVSNGFQLMVDSSADLAQVQEELDRKLAEHPEFFPEGTKFQLVVADLHKSVRQGLGSYLQSKGLGLADSTKKVSAEAVRPNTGHANAVNATLQPNSGRNEGDCQQVMKVINRTVRNGEEITSQGSLMVCGNVNPGAKLVAVGSIDVRGNCRGIVHAGAMGDYQAFVVADRLMPMQIRIANLIARSPDEPEVSQYAEKAYIKDGQIVIEPIER